MENAPHNCADDGVEEEHNRSLVALGRTTTATAGAVVRHFDVCVMSFQDLDAGCEVWYALKAKVW